jgi:hypothetical protein
MKRLILLLFSGAALCVSGCDSGSQSSKEAQVSGDSEVAQSGDAGYSDAQGDIVTNPSGVRYQEMTVGKGKEIVNGSYVEFDYGTWTADGSGLVKTRGLATSVGRPGQSFKAEVGVHPLPGLSDGVVGMRVGGSRRVFIPGELGFKSGSPFVGNNLIFEVIGIKEITPEEVTHYQDSVAQWLATARRHSDSIQQARKDSMMALGLDSLGRPVDSAKVGQ